MGESQGSSTCPFRDWVTCCRQDDYSPRHRQMAEILELDIELSEALELSKLLPSLLECLCSLSWTC